MTEFERIMDTTFANVRSGFYPESYQMAAARVIEERDHPEVRSWLETVGQNEILSLVARISENDTAYQDGAVSDAIRNDRQAFVTGIISGGGPK
jgi:hypothetical protein